MGFEWNIYDALLFSKRENRQNNIQMRRHENEPEIEFESTVLSIYRVVYKSDKFSKSTVRSNQIFFIVIK